MTLVPRTIYRVDNDGARWAEVNTEAEAEAVVLAACETDPWMVEYFTVYPMTRYTLED